MPKETHKNYYPDDVPVEIHSISLPNQTIPEGSTFLQILEPISYSAAPNMVGRYERVLALGNAAVGVPELGMAILRKAAVGAFDSLHNLLDVLGYIKQLRLIDMYSPAGKTAVDTTSRFKMISSLKKWATQSAANDEAKLEKSSFTWIALPSIGAAALAGAGLVNEIIGSDKQDTVRLADIAHLGATGAALALAGGLVHAGARMSGRLNEMDNPHPNLARHVHNFYSHAKLDVASSGAAVIEAIAHMAGSGVWAINVAVMGIAGYQAWRFWPSRVVTSHSSAPHTDHQHGHDCNHIHLVSSEAIDTSTAMLRKAKKIGGTAIRFASPAEKESSWRQERQHAKQAQRQLDNELRWWRYVTRTSQGSGALAAWANNQLPAIPAVIREQLTGKEHTYTA